MKPRALLSASRRRTRTRRGSTSARPPAAARRSRAARTPRSRRCPAARRRAARARACSARAAASADAPSCASPTTSKPSASSRRARTRGSPRGHPRSGRSCTPPCRSARDPSHQGWALRRSEARARSATGTLHTVGPCPFTPPTSLAGAAARSASPRCSPSRRRRRRSRPSRATTDGSRSTQRHRLTRARRSSACAPTGRASASSRTSRTATPGKFPDWSPDGKLIVFEHRDRGRRARRGHERRRQGNLRVLPHPRGRLRERPLVHTRTASA